MTTKTTAALTRNGIAVAITETAALNGETVELCYDKTIDGTWVSSGIAKVSRAKRHLTNEALEALDSATACRRGTSNPI